MSRDETSYIEKSPLCYTLTEFEEAKKKLKDGYDTDSGIGPFVDCLKDEGDQVYNEDEVPTIQVEDGTMTDKNTEGGGGAHDTDVVNAEVVEG